MSTPFDHTKAIYEKQSVDYFDSLSDAEKKAFNVYMVNRIISMSETFIPFVNELQQYWSVLSSREVFLFYSKLIPKGKYYHKYIKNSKMNAFDKELISTVANHFGISEAQAEEYTDILYQNELGKRELQFICEKYALSPKQIKKFKI